MTEIPEDITDIVDEIMEQAQCFASTWSLVGGRFDDGSKVEQAKEEKEELRIMLQNVILAERWKRVAKPE